MKPRTALRTGKTIERPDRGSATFLALFSLALLAFIGATVLMGVTRHYNGNEKVQGWQEALQAAEAGADIALQNVRWKATATSTPFDPSASPSWTVTGTGADAVYTYTTPTITAAGEGTVQTWAVVTVDTPSQLMISGQQWYRVRSTGHAKLSGLARASNDVLADSNARNKNALRKFNLLFDRETHAALTTPEAVRRIEQIVQPTGPKPFVAALQAMTSMDISGAQTIDSYDSTSSTKSTNGLYDPAKRQANGDIGIGGIRDGVTYTYGKAALDIGKGEKVYGDVGTNGGTFVDSNSTIQSPGTITNTVSNSYAGVSNPNWGTAINGSYTTISKATTLTVSSDPNQNNYKLTTIGAPLTVAPQGTDPVTGQPITGTINLWVTGDVSTQVKSGPLITVQKGVTLKIYLGTDGTGGTKNYAPAFHPQGYGGNLGAIDNQNLSASTFQLYGVGTAAGGSGGGGIDLHVGGSGTQNFYGVIYAPYRSISMRYDGKTSYDPNSGYYGSFVGDNFSRVDGTYHYDESLTSVSIGSPTDYARVSYVEDTSY